MVRDYNDLSNEIISYLKEIKTIVLATCTGKQVTARTMNLVNDGLTIYFQTGENSEKGIQIRENPFVAMAIDNIQIEAFAKFTTDESEVELCSHIFKSKFPQLYEKYADLPEEPTLICKPIKFKLYKVIDRKPCRDILDVNENKAYRIF